MLTISFTHSLTDRFRQLEVLQQVTTAFSSLVGGASTDSLSESGVPALASAEAREKRKRMGMLLRRVSRKTLSQTQIQTQDSQDTNPTPHSPVAHLQQPLAGPPDRRTPLKRARQGLAESICLTPLVEEQGLASEAPEPHSVPQEGALRLEVGKEYQPLISSGIPTRKKSPGEARESFEMEEVNVKVSLQVKKYWWFNVCGKGYNILKCLELPLALYCFIFQIKRCTCSCTTYVY